jgi:hypothetical protein
LPAGTTIESLSQSVPTEADLVKARAAHDGHYQTNGEQNGKIRGSVSFDPTTGLPTIKLFQSKNKSTFIHEVSHVFVRNLEMMATSENAPEWAANDWNTLRNWLGAEEGERLTREQHEKAADGFLNYLESGQAPTNRLKAIFKRFAKWLKRLFEQLKIMRLKMSREVKDVYARMLVPHEELGADRPTGESTRASDPEPPASTSETLPGETQAVDTSAAEKIPQPAVKVEQKSADERKAERAQKPKPEEDDAVYDPYTPAKLKISKARPHPADLIQSAAMAAVDPPDPTYSPKLPKDVIESGKLSEAQLEAVVYFWAGKHQPAKCGNGHLSML